MGRKIGIIPTAFVAAMALSQSAQVAASTTPADDAAIAKILDPTLSLLRAGKSRQAVDTFFTGSPIAAGKSSEMQMLANQVDSTVGIYGPFGECRMVEKRPHGDFVVQMLYHCQHKHYVTRWTFLFIKTTQGWQGGNIYFDDKVTAGLDD
ncbi:hypothetical protein [Novosphingobium sp.]|uniref:hypothetical protein n=1 Tax=Novosphingobium sp. TaxID=1874826 RepID=UPI0035B4A093